MTMENLSISKPKNTPNTSYEAILAKSAEAGLAGASSMTLHVMCLMWMRTIMNYQHRYGGGFSNTLSKLFHEPDIFRLYRGLVPALLVGPLYRFGDVASNMLAINTSKQSKELSRLPLYVQTAFGSMISALWRALILPINTWKTSKQVHGKDGLKILLSKSKSFGVSAFYQGALAEILATSLSHYSWFVIHNYLQAYLPSYSYKDQFSNAVMRSGAIGFLSTLGTDVLVNSVRIVKTFKQTSNENMSYGQVMSEIIKADGVSGVFLRGLSTKIIINSVQGASFAVSWKYMEHRLKESTGAKA